MYSTAQDFIYAAFRRCGQMRAGYTLQPELLNDGLNEFGAMFDGFNAERTMAYSVPDYVYPIGSKTGLNGIYGPNIQFLIGPAFSFTGTTVINSSSVAVANTFGLIIGQYVTGTGIPAGTWITAISINAGVTLSALATASGTVSITVNPDFVGPRPEKIIRMNLVYTATPHPIRLPVSMISVEQFSAISALAINPINVNVVCYYDPQYPCGVLNVWPPLNGNELEIFTWGFLTPPTDLAAAVNLPPGYQDVMIYGLAMRLWPMCTSQQGFNRVPHSFLINQAMIAANKVRRVNAPRPKLANDFSGGRQNRGVGVCDWDLLLAGIPY